MPRKAKGESQAEQSARFRAEVERRVADGDLSPAEAEAALDRLVRKAPVSTDGAE